MKKMISETLEEFLMIYEGLFTSLKQDIDKFISKPDNEKHANSLLSNAFAKQFTRFPKVKEKILSMSLEDKVKILQQCSQRLQDKTIGILKLFKDKNNKIIVGGVKVQSTTPGEQNVGEIPTK